jgi:transposase-like protein
MADEVVWPGARARGNVSRFDPAAAEAVLARVKAGESVRAICRDPGLPSAHTIYRWARRNAAFGEQFEEARYEARETRAWRAEQRRLGRWRTVKRKVRGGPAGLWSQKLADRVCFGLLEGVSLATVCRRRGMPAPATVYKWRRERPEFARDYQLARRMAVEKILDEAFEVGMSARGDDLTRAKLTIKVLKWKAARLGPRTVAR